ncbi:MAG: cupin domain-containing protein [Azospirillaceae bacterium]
MTSNTSPANTDEGVRIEEQAGADGTAATMTIRAFDYEKPADAQTSKSIVLLGRSDIMRAAVQVVREGGENNLHAHAGMDIFYMVLAGKVRFYGMGDAVLGEFGPQEGLLIPRNGAYWFESIGDTDLELLQVAAFDRGVENKRIDHQPRGREIERVKQFSAIVKSG